MSIVKRFTSSSDFVSWMEYLDGEVNAFHREDFALARIAMEIRRSYVKDPNTVTFDEFLPKFAVQKPEQLTPKQKMARSKGFWLSIIKGFKNKKRKK